MPRINTIQNQSRLQVTSPVSIGATGGARQEGEAIADVGDRMAKAGVAYASFATELKDTNRKLDLAIGLEKHNQAATLARYNTNNYIDGDGKPLTGDKKLAKFDEYYNQASKEIFGQFKGQDDEFKKQLYVEGFKVRNKIADDVLRDAMQSDVNSMEAKRTEALGTRIANVTANPLSAPQAIAENNKTWQELQMLGSPDVRLKKQKDEAKNISLAAINSLLSNNEMGAGRFETARQMIAKDLAPHLGADAIKFNDVVNDEEYKYKDRVIKSAHEADKKQKEAEKEIQEDNAAKYFVASASNPLPKKQEEIRNTMLEAVANGTLTPEAYKSITSQARISTAYNSDRAKTDYVYKITSKQGLGSISQRIMSDPALDPGDKQDLLRMTSTVRNARKNTDPLYQKNLKLGENMIKQQNGGVQGALGEFLVPGAKAKINNQMLAEYYVEIAKGTKPIAAANKVLQGQYDEVSNTKFVPQKFLPLQKQRSYQSMKDAEADVYKKYQELKSNKKGAEALELMSAYHDRRDALKRKEDERSK